MKKNFWVVGMLFGLTMIATAQAPQAKTVDLISYVARAKSLKKVLADLSIKTGQHLEPSPVLANYTIVANFSGVTATSMYVRLADLVSGVWVQSGSIFYLTPSGSVRAKDERKAAEVKLAEIKSLLEKRRKAIYTPLTNEEATQFVAASNQENRSGFDESKYISPEMRAVYQAMEVVDLGKIAAMKPGERIVFSTAPTPMQILAPGKLLQIASRYLTEKNLVMEAWQSATPNANYSENMTVGPVLRAGLSVSLQPNAGSALSLNLDVFGPRQTIIASASYNMGDYYQAFMASKGENTKGTSIKLSPLTLKVKAFLKQAFGMQGEGGPNADGVDWSKIDPAVFEFISKPEEVDMLDTVPTDAIMLLAETSHKNVLACLPDSLGMVLFLGEMMGGTDENDVTLEVFQSFLKEAQIETRDEEDWTLIRPRSFAPERASFMPRDILGTGIRSILKNPASGQSWLGPIFANLEFPETSYEILPLILTMYSGGAGMLGMADPQSVKAFSILSPGQFLELQRGGQVRWHMLSDSQKRFYFRQIFGASGYVSEDALNSVPDSPSTESVPEVAQSEPVQRMEMFSASRDATELLPTGIPLDSFFRLSTSEQPQYYIYTKDGGSKAFQNRPMQIEELGYYLMLVQHPEKGSPDQSTPKNITGFSRVMLVSKTLSHHLDTKHSRTYVVSQYSASPGGKILPLADMSADEKASIEKIIKESLEVPASEPIDTPLPGEKVPPVTSTGNSKSN